MGKYEMGRTLGEGHFGKVKLARHTDTGRTFAIKILDRQRILAMKINEQVRVVARPPVRFRSIPLSESIGAGRAAGSYLPSFCFSGIIPITYILRCSAADRVAGRPAGRRSRGRSRR